MAASPQAPVPYGSHVGDEQSASARAGSAHTLYPTGGDQVPATPYATGETHPSGMAVLVIGIASLICCMPAGIVAWILGNRVLAEMDAQPGRYGNRTITQVGRVLGMVATGLFALMAVLWVIGTLSGA